MGLAATAAFAARSTFSRVVAIYAPRSQHSTLFHIFLSLGLFGLFFVSIVDSSFVPLPVPGITDIMLLMMAARHMSYWLVLLLVASAGSAIGGYLSYRVGQSGGMAFLARRDSRPDLRRKRCYLLGVDAFRMMQPVTAVYP